MAVAIVLVAAALYLMSEWAIRRYSPDVAG